MAASSTSIQTQTTLLREKIALLNKILADLYHEIRIGELVALTRSHGGPNFIPGGMAEAVDALNLQACKSAASVIAYMLQDHNLTLNQALGQFKGHNPVLIQRALGLISSETKYSKTPVDYEQSLSDIEQRLAGSSKVSVTTSVALHKALRPEDESPDNENTETLSKR